MWMTSSAFPVEQVLREHNIYRCMHGVPLLTWNAEIAREAAAWTRKTHGQMRHGGQDGYSGGHLGQNLAWWSPRRSGDEKQGVDMWYNEIKHTNGGRVNTFGMGTGHYTQVVWRGTREVGCGETGNLLACDYYPAGNMQGDFTANVNGPTQSYSHCEQVVGSGGGGGGGGNHGGGGGPVAVDGHKCERGFNARFGGTQYHCSSYCCYLHRGQPAMCRVHEYGRQVLKRCRTRSINLAEEAEQDGEQEMLVAAPSMLQEADQDGEREMLEVAPTMFQEADQDDEQETSATIFANGVAGFAGGAVLTTGMFFARSFYHRAQIVSVAQGPLLG